MFENNIALNNQKSLNNQRKTQNGCSLSSRYLNFLLL